MTLQDIVNEYPNADFSQITVFANNFCVYDYKESTKCISLISDKNCTDLNQITLLELLDYSDECSFTIEESYLKCEETSEYFSSYDLNGNKLTLLY